MTNDPGTPPVEDIPDFFRGGVLYRIAHRFGVEPGSAGRTARRAAAVAALLWIPLVVLALLDGVALPGRVGVPLLLDVAAWVRPLVVIPLLLISRPILAGSWLEAGHRFRERGLVTQAIGDAYARTVDRTTRLAKHALPEAICFVLAAVIMVRLVVAVVAVPRDTWFATPLADGTSRLTLAGVWYAGVVHLVLFFLTLRWIWYFILWYRFLGGVSRLPLTMLPTHPDRAAGLGFLQRTLAATAPLAFAWSAALAGTVANRVLHFGERLVDFLPLGVGHVGVVLVVFVLPLVAIFGPLLARTRRLALEAWGLKMAVRGEGLGREISGGAPMEREGEAQSLEEIQIAVEAVRGILPLPFPITALAGPLAATAAPVLPLLFLAFPAQEILDRLVDLVM